MEGIPLTRASQLIHITSTLERHGHSPEQMLRQAKLPPWHYCNADDLIPAQHIYEFMEFAARNTGARHFGLLVGEETSIVTLGAFGRVLANSITTHHAFATSCSLLHLHTTTARNWLVEMRDEVWFCRSQFRGPQVGRRQMEQYILMRLIEHVGMSAGDSWRPAKICLQTHEAPDDRMREALGNPEIRIGQRITGIAVPRTRLAQPTRRRGTSSRDRHQDEQELLRSPAPAHGFVETLRQIAGTLLKESPPQIGVMAEIVGVSVRSLQRRLAAEGLTYSQLLDQARFQAARGLLGDAGNRITDIAMDLGYTDSAHFTRAFKRWAGVTPREYRSCQQMC